MGTRAVERGKAAERVSAAVKERRTHLGLSQSELAERLGEAGRPMQVTAVSKIEAGDRRVDVDDLMALATALEVGPDQLLGGDVAEVRSRAFLQHEADLQPVFEAARSARDKTGLNYRAISDYLRLVGPMSEMLEQYQAEKGKRRGKR